MPTEYRVQDGQNIFDVLISIGLPIEKAMSVIQASPDVDNIDFDFVVNPNTKVNYTPQNINITLTAKSQPPISENVTISAYDGQSLIDLALMSTGRIEDLCAMVLANGFGNTNYIPKTGDSVTFQRSKISDVSFYNQVIKSKYIFNTSDGSMGALQQENTYYLLQENGGLILY